jgi:hypothetical protein
MVRTLKINKQPTTQPRKNFGRISMSQSPMNVGESRHSRVVLSGDQWWRWEHPPTHLEPCTLGMLCVTHCVAVLVDRVRQNTNHRDKATIARLKMYKSGGKVSVGDDLPSYWRVACDHSRASNQSRCLVNGISDVDINQS